MYIETTINGKPLEAMLDIVVVTIYMVKEPADEIDIPYTKERHFTKWVNTRSLPIAYVTLGAHIHIGHCKGKLTLPLPP